MLLQALAEKALDAAARHAFPASALPPPPPVWARVDCVMRGDDALLMELELIEPVLFLDTSPGNDAVLASRAPNLFSAHSHSLAGAADVLARAIHQRVRSSSVPALQEQRHSSDNRAHHEGRLGESHGYAYKRSRND